jgi:hypothetical protein
VGIEFDPKRNLALTGGAMSMPEPDVHVRLDEERNYRLILMAEAQGVPKVSYARSLVESAIDENWGRYQLVISRLKSDGRL